MPDQDLEALYPRENGYRLITLKLAEARQLFNTLDPAPFHRRELDADAANWLFDAARELHRADQMKVVVYLSETDVRISSVDMGRAIHHYFHYRALKYQQHLRHLFRIGRQSLAVGVAFLIACDLVARYVLSGGSDHLSLARTGVSILGWVAMWKPVEIFLYEWWPLRRDEFTCRQLIAAPVEVRERLPGVIPAILSEPDDVL